jgi:hypothetical protein
MCKICLSRKMAASSEVAEARVWFNWLLRQESRGPGDTANAMRRVAQRAGVKYGELWSLRYREPKRVWADLYNKLAMAYRAECERQQSLLAHELEKTRLVAGPDHVAVRAAEALLRPSDKPSI